MRNNPRPFVAPFFNWSEYITSILQALVITAETLCRKQYAVYQGLNENQTRTIVFLVLITLNILPTLVNRSSYYSIITTKSYKKNLVPLIIEITFINTALSLFVRSLTAFFDFEVLYTSQLLIAVLIGIISVIWYELVKIAKKKNAI
jgi:Ca2+-transporting ATPase